MPCSEFERRLQELLDHRVRPEHDPALQAHADFCRQCRAILETQEQLFEGLELRADPDLPPDMAHRVLARASQVRRRQRTSVAWAASIAIAAMLLVAIMPMIRAVRQDESVGSPTVVALDPAPPPRVATSDEPDEFDAEELRRLMQQFVSRLAAARDRGFEPVDEIAGGFRPLASTLNVAIDALRRTIPVGRDHEPTQPQAHTPSVSGDVLVS